MRNFFRSQFAPAVILCVVLTLQSGCRSTQTLIEQGDKLMAEGKAVEAELEYQRALQKEPQSGTIQAKIAKALDLQGKNQEAFSAILRASELSPQDRAIRMDLADRLLRNFLASSRRSKAVYDKLAALSKQFLAEDRSSIPGLQIRGILALTDGRHQDAIQDLQALYQRDPSPGIASLSLMEALYFAGNKQEAEDLGQKLIDKDPKNRATYLKLYSVYVTSSLENEAAAVLENYLKRNGDDIVVLLQLVRHFDTFKEPDKARAIADRLSSDTKAFPEGALLVGQYYLERKQFPDAIRILEAGLKNNAQKQIDCYKLLAEAYRESAQPAKAIEQIEKARALAPTDDSLSLARAVVQMENPTESNIKEALSLLQALKKNNSTEPNLDYQLGRALTLSGRPEEGYRAFQDAVQRRRSNTDARFAIVAYSIDRRRYAEALQHLDQIELYAPDNVRTAIYRLRVLVDMRRTDEARTYLQQALKTFPDHPEIKIQQARIAVQAGKFTELVALLEPAYKNGYRSFELLALLAEGYAASNRLSQAIQLIEEERGRAPNNLAILLLASDLYERAKDLPKALSLLSQRAEDKSAPPALLMRTAFLYGRASQPDKAAALIERLVAQTSLTDQYLAIWLEASLESKNTAAVRKICALAVQEKLDTWTARNNCAYALAQSGVDLPEAERLARRALSDKPTNSNIKDTLAWVLTKKGDYDSALRLYAEIESSNDKDPQRRYHYGMALLGSNQTAKAEQQFLAALQLKPSDDLRQEILNALKRKTVNN